MKKSYIQHSKNKELSQNSYLKTIKVLNKKSGEINSLNFDLKKHYQNLYIDLIQNSIHITEHSKKNNLDTVLFLTFTLNTQFHQFKKNNNNKYIHNKNYEDKTINEGYQELNQTFRNIYKELKKVRSNRDNIEYQFIKVFEQHKSFTPHLHCLLFVNSEDLENTIKVIENKINQTSKEILSDTKIRYNTDIKKNKNNTIGRTEIEIMEDSSKGVGYISKYIKKQFTDNPYLLDGWKKINKIRLVTTSYNPIPKFIYKKVNKYIDKSVKEEYRNENKNLLNYIIENTKVVYFEDKKKNIKYDNGKKDNVFYVVVEKTTKEKILKLDYEEQYQEYETYKTITKDKYKRFDYLISVLNEEDKKYFLSNYLDIDLITYSKDYDYLSIEDYIILNGINEILEDLESYIQMKDTRIKYKTIDNITIVKNGEVVYDKSDFEVMYDLT